MHHRIPFFLALRLSVLRFQMPLEVLSFLKTLATFGLIYATDPLLHNMTNILRKKPSSAITPSPEELVGMFFGWADPPDLHVGFAVLPYIKGLTEPLSRLLRNNGIQTTSRPLKTLQQEFVSLKSRPSMELQTNVVYNSHAPIACGVMSVRLVDVYKQGRKNILETQKPSKKVPTLLHMPG